MAVSSKTKKVYTFEEKEEKRIKEEEKRVEFEKFMLHAWYWRRNGWQLEQDPSAPYKTNDELKYEFDSWKRMIELKNKKK